VRACSTEETIVPEHEQREDRDTGDRLDGRRVLVTGASSGIGAATARAIVAAGGRVALLARRTERVEELAGELDGVAVPADLVDVAATRAAVERAASELGGLDGLVNAAGVVRPGTIADADPSGWQLMFDVNVRGLLHATQAAIPHLRQGGGDVVNISSMSGRRLGSVEMAAYAASKAAVHAVSEGLRRELADEGVRVAVMAPGIVHTELFSDRDDATSSRLRDKAQQAGLRVGDVASSIVTVLAAPPHMVHVEVALLSLHQ
jgi:NADP-dependent 3-hydroxy acid dehydrogenase YdfG